MNFTVKQVEHARNDSSFSEKEIYFVLSISRFLSNYVQTASCVSTVYIIRHYVRESFSVCRAQCVCGILAKIRLEHHYQSYNVVFMNLRKKFG